MSSINNLYNIDNVTYNKSNYNMPSNYYEKKVKEGIQIFQEMDNGLYNTGLKNQKYVDPFELLENGKINNFIGSPSSSNLNISDIETRKIIEREMNPYLSKMKNELNIIVENFRKEMEEKSNVINEIIINKEQEKQLWQINDNRFTDIDKILFEIKNKLNSQEKKIDNCQYKANQIGKSMNDNMENIINNLNNKKNNDMNDFNDFEKKINDYINEQNYKYEQLVKNIDLIQKENDSLKNDMDNHNDIILNSLKSDSDNKNKILNDINTNYNDIIKKINDINFNNKKNLNIFNDFDNKFDEFQQKIKSINDTISSMNNNFNSNYHEIKTNKENINTLNQKILEMMNSIELVKKDRQNFNNNITEINIKLESQSKKIKDDYFFFNDVINNNNINLNKDVTTQISKTKDLLDNLKDDYDSEILKLRTELNQLDLKINNNPFLNLNGNERLSVLFKQEQLNANETFKSQIKLINEEINKIKSTNSNDRNSFITIDKNFKTIDKKLETKTKELEQSLKNLTNVILALSDKNAKKEQYSPNEKNIRDMSPISSIKIGEIEDNLQKMQKNVNNNKQEINGLKEDLKEINQKTIPEIYKFINNKLNAKQELQINNNNKIKENDYNNFNYTFNKNPVNTNNNNNNNNIVKVNDFSKNENILSEINVNNNDNNIVLNKNTNIDDLAGKIELMGLNEFDANNNKNENIEKSKNNSSFDKDSFIMKSYSKNKEYESDFDN